MNSEIINQAISENKFLIEVGSGDVSIVDCNEAKIKASIKNLIHINFFYSDFYYNYLPYRLQGNYLTFFKNKIVDPILADIDSFFEKNMTYRYTASSTNRKMWVINNDVDCYELFENDTDLLQDIKTLFQMYRFKIAGEKLSPNKYEYYGEWPNRLVQLKKTDGAKKIDL